MNSTDEAAVEDLADLYVIEKEVRSKSARERLGRMAHRKTTGTEGLRKASAARMLGVSVNTLDKWIGRGSLPVVRDTKTGRELVDIRGFVPVCVKVRALRAAGQREGIVVTAVSELEREDPEYQKSFAERYGRATARRLGPCPEPPEASRRPQHVWARGLTLPSGSAERELVQPNELDPQISALSGRRAGLQRRLGMLERDPWRSRPEGMILAVAR